jgi:hypothetical protein
VIVSSDIDYTSNDDVTIHWHEFIDHESGIKLYRVALGRECMYNLSEIKTGLYNGYMVQEFVQNLLILPQFPVVTHQPRCQHAQFQQGVPDSQPLP